MTSACAQLLTYAFGPGSSFEGRLVGALERLESGGALRILDALFILADADGGDLAAVNLRGDGAGGIVAPLLSFRMDPAERRRVTERTLGDRSGGIPAETVRALGAALEPGSAVAAVLVDHVWLRALDDAASRSGGGRVVSRFVDAAALVDVAPELLAAHEHRNG